MAVKDLVRIRPGIRPDDVRSATASVMGISDPCLSNRQRYLCLPRSSVVRDAYAKGLPKKDSGWVSS